MYQPEELRETVLSFVIQKFRQVTDALLSSLTTKILN